MSGGIKSDITNNSGGGGSSASFTTIQTDTGTSPVATGPADILTLTSSDGSVSIDGDAATDTVDFTVDLGNLPGVLPIDNGGTNSSTALNNNRVMQSSGGKIVEAAAITASRALVSDANGIPTHATTTATEIGYVSGVTSAIQTQLNGKQASGSYVTGPGPTVTANTIATFNGTGGLTIQSQPTTINSSGDITIPQANGRKVAWGSSSNGPFITENYGGGQDNLQLAGAQTTGISTYFGLASLSGNSISGIAVTGGANTVEIAMLGGASDPVVRGFDGSTGAQGIVVRGGNTTGAQAGRPVVVQGGNATGSSQNGGSVTIQGGTSSSGTAGVVQIGRSSTTGKNVLNNALGTPGSDVLTMTNGPSGTAGDPDGYLLITINGTDRYIPFWNA